MARAATKPKPNLSVKDATEQLQAAELRLEEVRALLSSGTPEEPVSQADLSEAHTGVEFCRLQLEGSRKREAVRAEAERQDKATALNQDMQNTLRPSVLHIDALVQELRDLNARFLIAVVNHNESHASLNRRVSDLIAGEDPPPSYLRKLRPSAGALNVRSRHVREHDPFSLAMAALVEGFTAVPAWKKLTPKARDPLRPFDSQMFRNQLAELRLAAEQIADHGQEPR